MLDISDVYNIILSLNKIGFNFVELPKVETRQEKIKGILNNINLLCKFELKEYGLLELYFWEDRIEILTKEFTCTVDESDSKYLHNIILYELPNFNIRCLKDEYIDEVLKFDFPEKKQLKEIVNYLTLNKFTIINIQTMNKGYNILVTVGIFAITFYIEFYTGSVLYSLKYSTNTKPFFKENIKNLKLDNRTGYLNIIELPSFIQNISRNIFTLISEIYQSNEEYNNDRWDLRLYR